MEDLIRKSLKHRVYLPVILLFIINISCQKQEIYSHFYEFKDAEWAQQDTLVFEIDSTLFELDKPYLLSIEVTNNVNYPYRNIWFFAQDNFQSDSLFTHQAKEYQLTDEFGKWHGSGFGSLFQVSLPLYDSIIFKERRTYQIKIEHGMRDDSLAGVEKTGIRLSLKK